MLLRLTFLFAATCVCLGAHKDITEGPCPKVCRCLHFQGLWSVYCNVTGIHDVPTGIPANTQLLDLSDNYISTIRRTAFQGLANLQQLDLSYNQLSAGSIDEGSLDLPMLQSVDLSRNGFQSIPKVLPKNITVLYFLYNSIEVLQSGDFYEYPSMEYVDLSNNIIRVIQEHAFDPLLSMRTIYMPFNNLTDVSIPVNCFVKNQNLTLIGLRFNKLNHMLPNLPPSLLHLDYVGNQITTIPSFAFTALPNLQTIELWNGEVAEIQDNAFYGLNKLTILDMMSDHVSSTLTKYTFNGLTGLQTLYMDENKVNMIEPGAFRNFGQATSLWFSGNQLSTLAPEVLDVKFLPHLSELFIDFNPWYCDCHLRWLREKVGNASYVIQDPHLIKCRGPDSVEGKAWDVLKPSDFVCP